MNRRKRGSVAVGRRSGGREEGRREVLGVYLGRRRNALAAMTSQSNDGSSVAIRGLLFMSRSFCFRFFFSFF